MNAFPMPYKIVATTLLTIFVVTMGVLNLRDRESWKDPTDGVFWVETGSGLKAAEVATDSPGARAGIKTGDMLISLDGKAIANLGEYFDELYRVGPEGSLIFGITSGIGSRNIMMQLAPRLSCNRRTGCGRFWPSSTWASAFS